MDFDALEAVRVACIPNPGHLHPYPMLLPNILRRLHEQLACRPGCWVSEGSHLVPLQPHHLLKAALGKVVASRMYLCLSLLKGCLWAHKGDAVLQIMINRMEAVQASGQFVCEEP